MNSSQPGDIRAEMNVVETPDIANINLRTKSSFALQHLRAAAQAARNAYEVEQANLAVEHGPWFDKMMLFVPVSVVMAGAALEANANEIIQDILDGSTPLSITTPLRLLLTDLKDDRTGNAPEKYRLLSLYFGKEPDQGTVAWQDARLLIQFRNRFMHFKPAWADDKGIHDDKLVNGLKSRIPVYRAYSTNFQFPYGFLTYGCAKWSVASVLNFAASFSALLEVKDRFVAEHLDFSLP